MGSLGSMPWFPNVLVLKGWVVCPVVLDIVVRGFPGDYVSTDDSGLPAERKLTMC